MTSQSCPICLSLLNPFIVTKNSIILKCSNCGLGVVESLKAQQGEYHRDDTYIKEEELFRNIFLKRVHILMKIVRPKNILEVGCSTGLMLSLFKEKDCKVLGVEMSKKAAQVAKKRGIEIIVDDFLNAKINQKFNLIIFNHTLEHISNPDKFIDKAVQILNSGGYLYIDLPNFGSLSSIILKGHWPLLLPSEHLWHFTPKSLSFLLKKHGFKIVYMEKDSGIWDYQRPWYGIFQSLIHFKKRFFRELTTAIPSWIVTKLQMGSDLMVIAKKI